jgi:hypothetical protein
MGPKSFVVDTGAHYLPQFLITFEVQILLQNLCNMLHLIKDDNKNCGSGNEQLMGNL